MQDLWNYEVNNNRLCPQQTDIRTINGNAGGAIYKYGAARLQVQILTYFKWHFNSHYMNWEPI